MTLTKPKPRRLSAEHRKRLGQHHHHTHHYVKTYWPYLPMVAILMVGVVANSWLAQAHRTVLGYATDMSIQELLDGTNTQRAANSEPSLTINAELDQAAQNKANDMAARDYWSHNTPDGQTPWTFISAAGYDYQTAGENLAYGFDTAGDTITGWMNSPEHRANILNTTYKDVGFGIVNIANYQNSGPETLVVAMYGSRASAAVAAATPAPTVSHRVSRPVAPAPTPVAASQPAPAVVQPSTPAATAKQIPSGVAKVVPMNEQRISRFQLVAANMPLNSMVLLFFAAAAFLFVLLRHGLAWRKVIMRGEAFVLHHPALDVVMVALITVTVVLTHTAGLIK